jgi:uncharacterized protein (DUF4213/DUF364 family)
MSSLSSDYLAIGERLAAALGCPAVSGLYLPAPVADETFRDEFGFVFLADGSVGPFYVSMGDILQRLWLLYPQPEACRADTATLLRGFASRDLASRALALGTYNALTASLYRAVAFAPPDRSSDIVVPRPPPAEPVGMVGYFCPLVDRLTEQGRSVLILERSPQRVPERNGVSVTVDPRDLRICDSVLCTASTLVNDSLEALLAVVGREVPFELIGPSGSGLPDPLFARGVRAVGGISFVDRERLLAHLHRGESWGSAGRKYQLQRSGYPGLAKLIERLTEHRTNARQP